MTEIPTRRWSILVAVCSGLFASGLTITALTAAVKFIGDDLGAGRAALSWVVVAPFLCRAVFIPAFGKLGDVIGRKRVWMLGFGWSTFFSFLCGFAPSIEWLVILRVLSAVASAAVIPTSLALIAEAFEPEERVRALGWWSATIALSPVTGLVLGGLVVEWFSWRWLFFGQFPFGIVALVVGGVLLQESRGGDGQRFDYGGAVLSILGLGLLTLVLNQGEDWGWTSPGITGSAVGAVVCLLAFLSVERRVASPVLPLQYFRNVRFAAATFTNAFAHFAYMGGYFITSLMLADVFAYTPKGVSLGVAPRAASLGLVAPLGGYFAARFGGRKMTIAGMVFIVGSMLALANVHDGSSYWMLFPGLVLSGFGLGLVGPPTTATVTNEARESDLSAASGALNLCNSVGGSMGIAVMQTLVTVRAVTPDNPGASAYAWAFLVGGGVCALGLVGAAFMGDERIAEDLDIIQQGAEERALETP